MVRGKAGLTADEARNTPSTHRSQISQKNIATNRWVTSLSAKIETGQAGEPEHAAEALQESRDVGRLKLPHVPPAPARTSLQPWSATMTTVSTLSRLSSGRTVPLTVVPRGAHRRFRVKPRITKEAQQPLSSNDKCEPSGQDIQNCACFSQIKHRHCQMSTKSGVFRDLSGWVFDMFSHVLCDMRAGKHEGELFELATTVLSPQPVAEF